LPPLARIFVRLPNWLGDALMARPLMHAVRAAHPDARILAVAPAPLLELLASDGVIDEALTWPAESDAASGPSDARGLQARIAAFRAEVALVLPPSFSSAWLAARSGASMRVGFRHEWRDLLLTHPVRRPARGDLHLSREYLLLGERIGARATVVPNLVPSASALDETRATLAQHGIGDDRFVVVGPGALYGPAKRWDASRFASLGRSLASRGLRVLVCGARSERDTCLEVAAGIGSAAVSLAGETSLPVQVALCARSALAVCNDSGLAHVAAAVGAPTVALFGSTSSAWTAPLGPRVRIIQRAPVCSPCFQRTCRIGMICMTAIEVADVARACDEVAA
jgi:heptosyltransferase II